MYVIFNDWWVIPRWSRFYITWYIDWLFASKENCLKFGHVFLTPLRARCQCWLTWCCLASECLVSQCFQSAAEQITAPLLHCIACCCGSSNLDISIRGCPRLETIGSKPYWVWNPKISKLPHLKWICLPIMIASGHIKHLCSHQG